ncbi:MAG: hypothetical protein CV090_02080 [Nitrospira sp. WS238]|nr:hypothetical protein [Nitrospira sp. WS238]
MTPTEAAAALFKAMPQPVTPAQLEEYGVETSNVSAQYIAREIVSLNLYWILAAIEAHIPSQYRASIEVQLFESIRNAWLNSGQLGPGTWETYQPELNERREHYARLADQEGISYTGICAETATLIEDQGFISSEDRPKLLVLLTDYTPASEYGRLLDEGF